MWALLKREYHSRLDRLGGTLNSGEQLRDMVQKLCEDVPVDVAALLREHCAYLAKFVARVGPVVAPACAWY